MTSFAHVLHSYARRARFWIFGAVYLLIALPALNATPFQLAISVSVAAILCALIALHARRQFATPQAHITPGFFQPHFAAVVVTSALACVVVPWVESIQMNARVEPSIWTKSPYTAISPLTVLSAHALAVVLLALVVAWPRSIVLLAVTPLGIGLFAGACAKKDSAAQYFVQGQFPTATYLGLIALAGAAYAFAGWRLSRLSDVSVATSDDFSIEPAQYDYSRSPWFARLQAWRDAAVDRRLAALAGHRHDVHLRRIPSAVSWFEMAAMSALVLALMPLAWYLAGDPLAAYLILAVGTGLMLFAPFTYWRFRLNALSAELIRPSTRENLIRTLMMAIGIDFLGWTLVAIVVAACGNLMLWGQQGFSFGSAVAGHAVVVSGMAILLCGIGLATLRLRYWMPLFIAALFGAVLASSFVVSAFDLWFRHMRWFRPVYVPLGLFALTCALIGVALVWHTYRRWLEADVA